MPRNNSASYAGCKVCCWPFFCWQLFFCWRYMVLPHPSTRKRSCSNPRRQIAPHVVAAHVAIDPRDAEAVRTKWEKTHKHWKPGEETKLVIIESPYRSLISPLLAYIDAMQEVHPDETLTVILSEFVVAHWWEYALHNQTAWRLKTALLARPGIIVTDIPQHLSHDTSGDLEAAPMTNIHDN